MIQDLLETWQLSLKLDSDHTCARSSQYLLRQLSDEESGLDEAARAEAILARARQSCFVQELVLSTLDTELAKLSLQDSKKEGCFQTASCQETGGCDGVSANVSNSLQG